MKINIQNKIKLDPSWPVPISLQNNKLLNAQCTSIKISFAFIQKSAGSSITYLIDAVCFFLIAQRF